MILTAQNLCKTYENGRERVKALDNVNLSVARGEFVAVVGSSGSGKSTLAHVLGGVDRPTSGTVTVSGEDITRMSDKSLALYRRRQVGLIYQFYNLIPVLTAKENILMPLLMDKRKPEEGLYEDLIDRLGLAGREDYMPGQLSGGQQQRVAIARRLITRPDIIIADEPTGNLDSKNSRRIMEILTRRNAELGRTLIVITHDEKIAKSAGRILVMRDGRLYEDDLGGGKI